MAGVAFGCWLRRWMKPLPRAGMPDDELRRAVSSLIAPYGVGNTHPHFFGWVHGSGTAESMIAEIWRAALNVNAGGGAITSARTSSGA